MALNAADPHHRPFRKRLLPLAVEKKMGIIGMKVPARGRIFRAGGLRSMREAAGYVWSLPVSTIIVGCDDIEQLEENVRLAKEFRPLPDDEMTRLEERTTAYARDASFYKFWS